MEVTGMQVMQLAWLAPVTVLTVVVTTILLQIPLVPFTLQTKNALMVRSNAVAVCIAIGVLTVTGLLVETHVVQTLLLQLVAEAPVAAAVVEIMAAVVFIVLVASVVTVGALQTIPITLVALVLTVSMQHVLVTVARKVALVTQIQAVATKVELVIRQVVEQAGGH